MPSERENLGQHIASSAWGRVPKCHVPALRRMAGKKLRRQKSFGTLIALVLAVARKSGRHNIKE